MPTDVALDLFEGPVKDSNALLAAMGTEIGAEVAGDSGVVGHVAGPDATPWSVEVKRARVRIFFWEPGGTIGSTFRIANVVGPLHSVGKICDE